MYQDILKTERNYWSNKDLITNIFYWPNPNLNSSSHGLLFNSQNYFGFEIFIIQKIFFKIISHLLLIKFLNTLIFQIKTFMLD